MAFKNIKTAADLLKEKEDAEKEKLKQEELKQKTSPESLSALIDRVTELEKRIDSLEGKK